MGFSPGIVYLLRLFPHFAIPSTTTYIFLALLQNQLEPKFHIPTWIIVFVAAFARPILFFLNRFYSKWANKRAAAAHGAILAPYVQQSPLSIISQTLEGIRSGYPGDVMLRWNQEYGNVVQFELVTRTTLSTVEPEHVKAILATQVDSFEKGRIFHSQMNSLMGTGVFNADGEMWKFHRAMTRPFFTRQRISDFEIYARNSDLSLRTAKERLVEGYSVDIQDLVSRFTLDSTSEFLFGGTVGSLSAGIPYPPSETNKNTSSFNSHPSTTFVKALNKGLVQAAVRLGMGEEWALAEFSSDKIAPLRKIMDDFTEPLMKKALEKREKVSTENGDPSDKEEETLLAHLVNRTQEPKILKDELINLLAAGRDTTMSLLTFSLYMLTQHPDIEKRLRREIFDEVGPTGIPNYDHMREMRYMKAFLNEVLRLYPPVPINLRTPNKPVILPAGSPGQKPIYVPADTTCLYSVLNIQRRTDLWGPDALQFDPERFLDERVHKYLTPNPYIFCPFNAGPRICLGQQFAYQEATFYLVRILQQFTGFTLDMTANTPPPANWALGDGLKPKEKIHPMSHLTMYVKGGLWVQMEEIENGDV